MATKLIFLRQANRAADCAKRLLFLSALMLLSPMPSYAGNFDFVRITVFGEPIESLGDFMSQEQLESLRGHLYIRLIERASDLKLLPKDLFSRAVEFDVAFTDLRKESDYDIFPFTKLRAKYTLRLKIGFPPTLFNVYEDSTPALGISDESKSSGADPAQASPLTRDVYRGAGTSFNVLENVVRDYLESQSKVIYESTLRAQWMERVRPHSIGAYTTVAPIAKHFLQKSFGSLLLQVQKPNFSEHLVFTNTQIRVLLENQMPETSFHFRTQGNADRTIQPQLPALATEAEGRSTLAKVQAEIDEALATASIRHRDLDRQILELKRTIQEAQTQYAYQTAEQRRQVETLQAEERRVKLNLRNLHQSLLTTARQFESEITRLLSGVTTNGVTLERIATVNDSDHIPNAPAGLSEQLLTVLSRSINANLSPLATNAPPTWRQAGLKLIPQITLLDAVAVTRRFRSASNLWITEQEEITTIRLPLHFTLNAVSGRAPLTRTIQIEAIYGMADKSLALTAESQQVLTAFIVSVTPEIEHLVQTARNDSQLYEVIQAQSEPMRELLSQVRIELGALNTLTQDDSENAASACGKLLEIKREP